MAKEYSGHATGQPGDVHHSAPPVQLGDYDFLRATYEALLRASQPDLTAINSAFEALEAAHERLRAEHLRRFAQTVVH